MWESEEAISLPRSKQQFFISSHKGDLIFIKPGKGYLYNNGGWSQMKTLGFLTHKVCRVVHSQSRRICLHLPKVTPILAMHESRQKSVVLTLPIPFNFLPAETPYGNICQCINPEGEKLCVATSHQRVGDFPFIFSQQAKLQSSFASHVRHMAVNDDGRIIAVDFDDQLWVWNQLPEQIRGDGNWVNLSAEDRFNYQQYERYDHTFPLSFQKLGVFRNPDEGPGVCFLTCLLPPCKPFDMLYLFNSVCIFAPYRKIINTYYTTIPVLEGHERPTSFWSPCCRILVLSVNKSLILLTRELQIITTIPLNEVFLGQDPMVADLAWSAHSQFFMMTSTSGFVGLVTRDGKSMLHHICDLPLFQEDYYLPLNLTADTKDPNLFIIYSQRHMRSLRIDAEIIPRSIPNLLALPFPTKNAISLFERTINEIEKVDPSNPYEVVQLIYYSDLFGVFRYQNPVRLTVFQKLNEAASVLLDEGHHLFVYFLIRCILYVTEKEPDAYHEVMKRLGFSNDKRDKIMLRFLNEELERRDWGYRSSYRSPRIQMYLPTNEDECQMKLKVKPDPKRDEELNEIINHIYEIFYDVDFYEVKNIPVDVSMLFEIMVELERFDRAAILSKHESVQASPVQLMIMISSIHSDDPVAIFRAMEVCINSSPIDEPELRAVCVLAFNNILKQMIADTAPTAENPRPPMISNLCVFEETADIPIPTSRDQCKDFAVLCGLAFCAADYTYVQDFCNGKSMNIPNQLCPAIRELIRLIWFVRWRYQAMRETILNRKPGNASLRLIPFPDFINQEDVRSMIKASPKSYYDPAVYDLYMEGAGEFEDDPEFVDYICEISLRITPRLLSKIQIAVQSFEDTFKEIPQSSILTAVICSHIIPWLRCGIPRAMARFEKAPEIVPNRLLVFEDFSLLDEKKKPFTFDVKPSFDIPGIVEIPDSEDDSKKKNIEIEEEEEDDSVTPPQPPAPPEMPDSIPSPSYDEERQLSEGEEPPKPKIKKEKPAKKKYDKNPKPQKKIGLKLIEVDRTPPSDVQPIQVPIQPPLSTNEVVQGYPFEPLSVMPPYQLYPPPVAIFQAVHAPFPQQSYGPIWDLDPSLYERPYPRPPPNIPLEKTEDKPQRQTASAQCEPRKETSQKVLIMSTQRQPEIEDISDDSCKDISFDSEKEIFPPIDPFPLDDELNKRVDELLKNPINIKTPKLPIAPKYTTKIIRREHIIDQHEYKEVKK